MKAGVFYGPRKFRIENVPEPRLEPEGIIVRVKACGICGSDVHYFHNAKDEGIVMGHEFSGDVVEVGNKVTGIKKGDRVAAMTGKGCGTCYFCQRGDIVRCSKMVLLGYGIPGAFAEYVSVPYLNLGTYAAKLPCSVTYEEGATLEPLSVALRAVKQAQPQKEDTVIVLGLGIIGLMVIRILKTMGVSHIIASGRREKRLQLAAECGADIVVDAAESDITRIDDNLVKNRGADIVFDCAGSATTFEQALKMVCRGGKVSLVGLYQESFNWSPTFLVGNDISLLGCGLKFDIPGALELVAAGKVDTRPFITHTFPLDRIQEAFETQEKDRSAVKVLVKP